MTRNEIKEKKKLLPKTIPGEVTKYTEEQKLLKKELSCREMINSILCYYGEKDIEKNRYLTKHIFDLGIKRVRELCEEQISDFRKAKVVINVNGSGYNAIVWADE